MRLFLATSDPLSYILKPFAWLMDKYVPEIEEIVVLGYSVFPALPERYKCVSLAEKQEQLSYWTRNLYNYFNNIDDEYVIFGLEDFLPIRSINFNVFARAFSYMKSDSSIGRYEIGTGHCWHPDGVVPVLRFDDYMIYEYGEKSLYRISTQFAIWRRKYLLKYLNFDRTPWEFETIGSAEAAIDHQKVIATKDIFAWEWVHSALSGKYPGMVNVTGIPHSDVEEMIALGLLERDKLQIGLEIDSPRYE